MTSTATTTHTANLTWACEGNGYEAWSEDSSHSAIIRNETVCGFVFAPEGAPGPEFTRGQVAGGWAWEVWNEDDEVLVASGMASHADAAKDACVEVIPAPVW